MADGWKKGAIFELVLYTGYARSGGMHTASSFLKYSLCQTHEGFFEFVTRKRDTAVTLAAPL